MYVCVCVLLQPVIHLDIMLAIGKFILGMKVIRHAGVDSRMIILNNQTRQQMTLHFQLSLQYNVSPITGIVGHSTVCLMKPVMGTDKACVYPHTNTHTHTE